MGYRPYSSDQAEFIGRYRPYVSGGVGDQGAVARGVPDMVKRQWAELVERAEGVDRIWPIDMTVSSWVREGLALRDQRFDLCAHLQGLFRSGSWRGSAVHRQDLDLQTDEREVLGSIRAGVPIAHPDVHAVDRYLSMVGALGVRSPEKPQFRFRLLE